MIGTIVLLAFALAGDTPTKPPQAPGPTPTPPPAIVTPSERETHIVAVANHCFDAFAETSQDAPPLDDVCSFMARELLGMFLDGNPKLREQFIEGLRQNVRESEKGEGGKQP
jgi:hypothetical protein